MTWNLIIAEKAEKGFAKHPNKDKRIIASVLTGMRDDPFRGDVKRLHNERANFRRRVGNYRIFFDADPISARVDIVEIVRRTSTTY